MLKSISCLWLAGGMRLPHRRAKWSFSPPSPSFFSLGLHLFWASAKYQVLCQGLGYNYEQKQKWSLSTRSHGQALMRWLFKSLNKRFRCKEFLFVIALLYTLLVNINIHKIWIHFLCQICFFDLKYSLRSFFLQSSCVLYLQILRPHSSDR